MRGKIDTKGVELCEAANRFLKTKSKGTSRQYRICLKRFVVFYGDTVEVFINREERQRLSNMELPVVKRKRYAEDVVRDWISWLAGKGYSPKSINQSLAGLQNLMQYYQLPLSYRFIEKPAPIPLPKNKKHSWSLDEVKEFIDAARYVRDKAIMLCLFQSGLSLGDLIRLNYGNVSKELEEGRTPLLLHLHRKKTGVEYKTFFGRDALHYLKLYLRSRKNIRDGDPLFTMLGSKKRVTKGAIQKRLYDYAENLDFIDEEDLEEGWNPARPHSLRSAFNSRLTGKVDRTLIEFWMGHHIGEEKRAYLRMPDEELREQYANHEDAHPSVYPSIHHYSVFTYLVLVKTLT